MLHRTLQPLMPVLIPNLSHVFPDFYFVWYTYCGPPLQMVLLKMLLFVGVRIRLRSQFLDCFQTFIQAYMSAFTHDAFSLFLTDNNIGDAGTIALGKALQFSTSVFEIFFFRMCLLSTEFSKQCIFCLFFPKKITFLLSISYSMMSLIFNLILSHNTSFLVLFM